MLISEISYPTSTDYEVLFDLIRNDEKVIAFQRIEESLTVELVLIEKGYRCIIFNSMLTPTVTYPQELFTDKFDFIQLCKREKIMFIPIGEKK